jgi:long-chain acyl-CoA synthetase
MFSTMQACALLMVQDQEQVDKIQSMADQIPGLTDIIYDEPRGLRDYDHSRLHEFGSVQDRRAGLWRRIERLGDIRLGSRHPGFRWQRNLGDSLYTSGTTGRSKGVMLTAAASVKAARRHCQVRQHDRV